MTGAPLAAVVGETVPHGAVEQETLQLTPANAGSLFTVAENCSIAPTCSTPVVGATETLMAETVIVAEADFDGFATEVAVTVTDRLLAGAAEGA